MHLTLCNYTIAKLSELSGVVISGSTEMNEASSSSGGSSSSSSGGSGSGSVEITIDPELFRKIEELLKLFEKGRLEVLQMQVQGSQLASCTTSTTSSTSSTSSTVTATATPTATATTTTTMEDTLSSNILVDEEWVIIDSQEKKEAGNRDDDIEANSDEETEGEGEGSLSEASMVASLEKVAPIDDYNQAMGMMGSRNKKNKKGKKDKDKETRGVQGIGGIGGVRERERGDGAAGVRERGDGGGGVAGGIEEAADEEKQRANGKVSKKHKRLEKELAKVGHTYTYFIPYTLYTLHLIPYTLYLIPYTLYFILFRSGRLRSRDRRRRAKPDGGTRHRGQQEKSPRGQAIVGV